MIMSSSRSRRSLHGRPVLQRAERGERRPLRRLALLAAEAAAHAAHLDGDGVVVQAEHVGDDVLHLARMLGRGIDEHVAVLAGDGERDLAFEIEMLLAADAELAGDLPSARGSISSAGSPRLEGVVGQHRGRRRPARRRRRSPASPARSRSWRAARRGAPGRGSRRPPRRAPGRRTSPRSARSPDRRRCSFGLTSFLPGMSAAVSTATTPGALRTASRSSAVTRPAAIGA